MITSEALLINEKTDTVAYLNTLEKEVAAGHLTLLPADSMHKESDNSWVSRRYLDHQSGDIFRLKGPMGGLADQYFLRREIVRTKTALANGTILVESDYNFRFLKPPLFGGASLRMELTPPFPDKNATSLTIDLSTCQYRVSNEINRQLVDAVTINSITRSFTFRRSLFSTVTVRVTSLIIHSIDTGFDTVDYTIRRCLDQAFDDGQDEPTVTLDNGLTIKKPSLRNSGSLSVNIIPRTD
ncbi:hypothetical protein [Neolewinella persica]|uniref:hypothetical protein n=1 Tax=Neolewinella persica TaxID=70998 RepID=UPI00037750B3|nr:hypothetical protein [Neolewinella persica]